MIRSTAVFSALALASTLSWGQAARIGDDEMAVLGQMIEATHVKGGEQWFLVANDTANFRCDAKHMINVGGCNGGMRDKAQKPEEVMAWLHDQFPAAAPELLADFRQKSDFPATVGRPFAIPVKQTLWGPKDGQGGVIAGEPVKKELGPPDYLIAVSRVGFNSDHSEALAYLGAMSWKDPKLSGGEFIYSHKVNGQWAVDKVARTWHLSPQAAPAAPSGTAPSNSPAATPPHS